MNLIIKILFALQFLHFISSESKNANGKSFSASITDMIRLQETELQLIKRVENYVDELQYKVNVLKNLVVELKAENQKSFSNQEKYFNPLIGYGLIRRMTNDWPRIEFFIKQAVGQIALADIREYKPEMPTATDLDEAMESVHRLQAVYNLTVDDLVEGLLNGKQYGTKLKSIDSYFMGDYLFSQKHYNSAERWLFTSSMSYEEDSDFNKIVGYDKVKLLKLYAEVLLAQNRNEEALNIMKAVLELNSSDTRLQNLINTIYQLAYGPAKSQFLLSFERNYERGCRGQFANETSKMFCILNTTTTPFLRLAPVKMEILHLEPYMVLFHEIISDQEIEHLINLSRPNLARAYIIRDGKIVVSNVRTSKNVWIVDDRDEITKRINKRITDITGFDINGSEPLQVVNYGLGGHYGSHYDFLNASANNPLVVKEGDRIATVLFYLSDVEQGGATVFPQLKTAVFPRKGSAVVWYNLNNKLEPDELTKHAACPVIVGSKWVCNKWIRSKAQMFKKPCYK